MALYNCTICNTSSAKACAACRSAAYCSPECQQTDWPLHKTICSGFTVLPLRPSPLYKLGFLFPVTSKVPELIWVPCEEKFKDDFVKYEQPITSSFLDNDNSSVGSKVIARNHYRGFDLDHAVVIFYREASRFDGSKSNECVISTTRRQAATDWRGPIIIMSWFSTNPIPDFYQDITASDLRVAVDFVSHRDRPAISLVSPHIPGNKVQGVKINCHRDIDTDRVGQYMPVMVPIDHPVFVHAEGPRIPELLEIELFVWKYPPSKLWIEMKDNEMNPYENDAVRYFYLHADRQHANWGLAPFEWTHQVGSVVVVRADKRAITPRQIEGLCTYCRNVLLPLFEESMGGVRGEGNQEKLLTFMTGKYFEIFFRELRRKRAMVDPSWAEERSPYDG
jgi:hypothetical protein